MVNIYLSRIWHFDVCVRYATQMRAVRTYNRFMDHFFTFRLLSLPCFYSGLSNTYPAGGSGIVSREGPDVVYCQQTKRSLVEFYREQHVFSRLNECFWENCCSKTGQALRRHYQVYSTYSSCASILYTRDRLSLYALVITWS